MLLGLSWNHHMPHFKRQWEVQKDLFLAGGSDFVLLNMISVPVSCLLETLNDVILGKQTQLLLPKFLSYRKY